MTMSVPNDLGRVLLVTRPEERATLAGAFARAGVAADVELDPDRALARALDGSCALVVAGLAVPTSIELTRAVRGRGGALPILLAADGLDDELAAAARDAGVTDVLERADHAPARLAMRVNAALCAGRTVAEAAATVARARAAAAARDELLAIVSHDLRSPLNAIVLACDALEVDLGESERKRYVAAVRRAGQRAERLLRDLLDVSRLDSGGLNLERRPVTARAILEQTRADHELIARDAGSPITIELTGDPGQLHADRDRLLQVMANLVGNALRHAPGAPITLAARGTADAVELSVADQGPGIQPDALAHVFERFWHGRSRRRTGARLGLAIARGIVEAHGGTITATSEVGHGARFTLRIPRSPEA
jgi:signal transduction histidine kinase